MKRSKQEKLENAGWRVGSAADFLELTEEEELLVNIKLLLAKKVRELREQLDITQQQLAKQMKSSQSRIAKMEGLEGSVSLDLLVRSLGSLGATQEQIGGFLSYGGGKKSKQRSIASRKVTAKKQQKTTK